MRNYLLLFVTTFFLCEVHVARGAAQMRFVNFDNEHHRYDYSPSVIWDGTQWVMYYCGHKWATAQEPESDGIFRKVSQDGIHWSAEGLPILTPGSTGTWDSSNICDPNVVRYDGGVGFPVYYMFYTGTDGYHDPSTGADEGWRHDQIGAAVSYNGVQWTKLGVALSGCMPCANASVAKGPDGTYVMAFDARQRFGYNASGVSFSSDLTQWSVPAPLRLESGADGPDIMWDQATRTWLALTLGRSCSNPNEGGAHQSQYVYRTASLQSIGQTLVTIPFTSIVACIDGRQVLPNGPGSTPNQTMNESGLFRDTYGQRALGDPLRIAFAAQPYDQLGCNEGGGMHCDFEQIDGARFAIFDEPAGLDSQWALLSVVSAIR